jgi:hypothetical protein
MSQRLPIGEGPRNRPGGNALDAFEAQVPAPEAFASSVRLGTKVLPRLLKTSLPR